MIFPVCSYLSVRVSVYVILRSIHEANLSSSDSWQKSPDGYGQFTNYTQVVILWFSYRHPEASISWLLKVYREAQELNRSWLGCCNFEEDC